MTSDQGTEPQESCPSETELQAFLSGGLKGQSQTGVEAHLADCARCRIAIGDVVETSSPCWPTSLGVRTLAEGEVVAGRYTIGPQLGKGGMGEVYAAHDALLQEQVALKTLLFTTLDDPEAVRRMKAEVQLARRVTHPNVCRILEFGLHQRSGGGTTESIPYLTMELLQGKTLAQHLRQRGTLPWKEAVIVFRQVISGLAAIHTSGIVHRDFKGENVFLTHDPHGLPRAVITDFGLAKSRDDQRSRSSIAFARGTLAYMAPEQLEGKAAQMPADVYALGTVMFEALVGQLPFATEPGAPPDLWSRCRKKAPRIRDVTQAVPVGWGEIIDQTLQRDADKRFADGPAILAALDGKPLRKARGRVLLVAAISVVGLPLAIYLGSRGHKANTNMPRLTASPPEQSAPVPLGSASHHSAAQDVVNQSSAGRRNEAPPTAVPVRRRSRPKPEPRVQAAPSQPEPTPEVEPAEERPASPDGIVNPFPRIRSRANVGEAAGQGAR